MEWSWKGEVRETGTMKREEAKRQKKTEKESKGLAWSKKRGIKDGEIREGKTKKKERLTRH